MSKPQPAPADEQQGTQGLLLRALLRQAGGVTVEALAGTLDITRNAVRQHLAALERDGFVARGATQPSGGRPEQLYVLTDAGREKFPRQYSWFSEMLLETLTQEVGQGRLEKKLADMGAAVGASLKAQLPAEAGSAAQVEALAKVMTGIGYDAHARTEKGRSYIEAHNCVFHRLARENPQVCAFDTALLEASTGCGVEHRSCMVRGGDACRFHFSKK